MPRHAHNVSNPKRKPIVPAKDSTNGASNHLPKQLKWSHCGRNNHAVENCFALHPEKQPSSTRGKALEAKIGSLEEKFKIFASSGQILDSLSSSRDKASCLTPGYYMFGASREVVNSAAVTRVQSVAQITSSTIGDSMESLRVWKSGLVDQMAKHTCHCLLAWQMLSNL